MQLHHAHHGAGPDLVLVHGITESSRSFDPLIPLLAANYSVTAVDLRGHGASPHEPPYDVFTLTQDLVETVTALALDNPVLVGHSLGGNVVSLYPALAGCRGVINVDQPLALGSFQSTLASLEPQLRGTPEQFRGAVDVIFAALRGVLNDAEWARLAELRQYDTDVVLGVWDLVLTTPAADLDAMVAATAQLVTVPYLSLHGIDPGEEYGPWLTDLVPTATVECWSGLGHYPHLVEPARFVARVDEFVAALP